MNTLDNSVFNEWHPSILRIFATVIPDPKEILGQVSSIISIAGAVGRKRQSPNEILVLIADLIDLMIELEKFIESIAMVLKTNVDLDFKALKLKDTDPDTNLTKAGVLKLL